MSYDLVIKNATICDGTGAQPYISSVAVAEGKIGAEHDLRHRHDHFQRSHLDRVSRPGGVVVEAPQVIEARVRFCWPRQAVAAGGLTQEALGKRRDGSAGMRKDEVDIRAGGCAAALDQADDGPAGVGIVLDGRFVDVRLQVLAAGRRRGMRIDRSEERRVGKEC